MWRVAGEQEQAGGAGVAELAEDGSQRVHGARTDTLSLSGKHVSLKSSAVKLSVLSENVERFSLRGLLYQTWLCIHLACYVNVQYGCW